MAVAFQAESAIVPVCPAATAEAPENVIVPKFVSGSVRQPPKRLHADGASAIHSADETSGEAIRSFLAATVPRVTFLMRNETVWPLTLTEALTVSPGRMVSFKRTELAGTSSYQAE